MAETKELSSIIKIDNEEYEVVAKTAEKVAVPLTIKVVNGTEETYIYDGSNDVGKHTEVTIRAVEEAGQLTNGLTVYEGKDATKPSFTFDGSSARSIKLLAASDINEENITLKSDLYTYVPIGNAQKASQEVIGSGSTISATNRGKIGSTGDSLKSVFNKVFGEQTDTQPTITTSDVKLNVTAGTTSYGSSTTEVGTEVSTTTVDVTFTLSNSGTAEYGYRVGTNKTSGSQPFYYPITKQSEGDLKITLPSGQEASAGMVTAGTYVSHSSNVLYCDFDTNKKVTIKISLPKGNVTTSSQTRYGQITASVILGSAQKENQLTTGTAITKFLTYLGRDATNTSALNGGTKQGTAGAYTLAAGKYYNYYLASTTTSLSNNTASPVTTATQFSSATIKIDSSAASHIWFLMPPGTSGSKTIQYEPFANTWVDAFGGDSDTTMGPVDVALKLVSGSTVTYKGYYTSAKAAAGSSLNYKIV